jgi:hypothetical protein
MGNDMVFLVIEEPTRVVTTTLVPMFHFIQCSIPSHDWWMIVYVPFMWGMFLFGNIGNSSILILVCGAMMVLLLAGMHGINRPVVGISYMPVPCGMTWKW